MGNANTFQFATTALLWAALIVVGACAGARETSVQETRRVENAEYRFSVAIPVDRRVCLAASGGQEHGFFFRLTSDAGDCQESEDAKYVGATISIYAYSNATFEETPEKEVSGICQSGVEDQGIDLVSLSFPGRKSAKCQARNLDGSIDVYVVTQAGTWPEASNSPELRTPYVNYTAVLHTFSSRMIKDIETFREVLATVQIGYEK